MSRGERLPQEAIERFCVDLTPRQVEIVKALRNTIDEVAPDTTESTLWGGISYHRADVGGRVKGAVCGIGCQGEDVVLGFIHGVLLDDPYRVLSGEGKSKRQVVIEDASQAGSAAIRDLIRQASRIDWSDPGSPSSNNQS